MDTEKLKVLLIEDNAGDARLIKELVAEAPEAPFRLEHVDTIANGLARLAEGGVDVILLDLSLPDSQELDGLDRILAQTQTVPIVVLSGLIDDTVALKAVQTGAQDYLVKGSADRNLLVRTIHHSIERQRLRVALGESEARYRLLADNMADVIWTADSEARITYVSPSIKRLLGYTVEEAMKLKISDFLAPDSADQARRFVKWQTSLYGRGSQPPPASMTLEHVRKDDSTVWAEVMLSFLQGRDGRITGIMGATRDITERKKSEEALRENEERYRELVENANDIIYTHDLSGNFTSINRAGELVTGYMRDEVTEMNISRVLAPESLELANQMLARKTSQGGSTRYELEIEAKDGHPIPLEVSSRLIYEDGKPVGVQGIARDITERKRMEDALRESEERFRAVFEGASLGVALVGFDRKVIGINPAFEKMLGYSLEEFRELTNLEYLHPDDAMLDAELYIEMLKGKRDHYTVDKRYIRKDGQVLWGRQNLSVIRGAEGKPRYFIAMVEDITERRHMEEALRQSEQDYRTLFDSTIDGMAVIDAEMLKVLLINQRILDKYGSGFLGDISEVNLFDFVHPDDRERAFKHIVEDLFEKETHEVVKIRAINSDGKVFWLSCRGVRIEYQGRPAGLVSLRDITEQEEAEEALRQSEHNYRALFESTIDGMLVTDAENVKVVLANQTLLRMFGFDSVEDVIGLNPIDLVHPEDQNRALGYLREDAFGNSKPEIHEFRAITRDGREIWASGIGSRINYAGKPAVLSSIRDITARKRVEEEKRKLEEQIQLAGRLAAVGELAAGVAHELNNPIAAIKGFAQLLAAREDVDIVVKKDLQTIFIESQRASKITQNMLTFARRHEPEKRFISINEALEKTLELRAHQMKVNNIELEAELDRNLPNTMADFYQMQQIFLNIVNNAEQAMVEAHGKGKLIVKTRKVGGMAQISFTDDGPGISEENLKRIFDPFFTTKEVGKGTGLGLSICYGLVEAHCGRIYAKSKPGKGATFVVEIPIVSEEQAKAESAVTDPGSRGVIWTKQEWRY